MYHCNEIQVLPSFSFIRKFYQKSIEPFDVADGRKFYKIDDCIYDLDKETIILHIPNNSIIDNLKSSIVYDDKYVYSFPHIVIKKCNIVDKLIYLQLYTYDGNKFIMRKVITINNYGHCTLVNQTFLFYDLEHLEKSGNTWTSTYSKKCPNNEIVLVNIPDLTIAKIPAEFVVAIKKTSYISRWTKSNPLIKNRMIMLDNGNQFILFDIILQMALKKFEKDVSMVSVPFRKNDNSSYFIDDFYHLVIQSGIEYSNGMIVHYHNDIVKIYELFDGNELVQNECIVCFNHSDLDYVLVPCGHRKYCRNCIQKIPHDKCAICGQYIESVVKIFD
jgi:hypothetical protein